MLVEPVPQLFAEVTRDRTKVQAFSLAGESVPQLFAEVTRDRIKDQAFPLADQVNAIFSQHKIPGSWPWRVE